MLFWRAKRGNSVKKAIRDGDYKYLTEIVNDSILFEKLFNLDDDPSEQHPVKILVLLGDMINNIISSNLHFIDAS